MNHHCFVLILLLPMFSNDINPSLASVCFLFRKPNESGVDIELRGKEMLSYFQMF